MGSRSASTVELAEGMDRSVAQRRRGLALALLAVSAVVSVLYVQRSGVPDARRLELLSAIDEYLEGKYGTGGSQSLMAQVNSFDHTGYADSQNVAKEFGLSDNDNLVRSWDEGNTRDSLDDSEALDSEQLAAPERAAALVSSVFGAPARPAQADADTGILQHNQAVMRAAGAKQATTVSMAAQRKAMKRQMLKKFEAQAEATTKKVAAETPDTIGDGLVPDDSSYLALPTSRSTAVSSAGTAASTASIAVPALQSAAKAVAKTAAVAEATKPKPAVPTKPNSKATAAATPAASKRATPTTAASKTETKKERKLKAAAKPVAAKPAATKPSIKAVSPRASQKAITGKKVAPARAHASTDSASALAMKAEIRRLQAEVKAKTADAQLAKQHHAALSSPPQSWSGLAHMLDSESASEVQGENEQKRLLERENDDTSASSLLSDPEDDLNEYESPEAPTGTLASPSPSPDLGALYTTLKKNEDPAAAEAEEMYRKAEEKAMSTLHPVREYYTDRPEVASVQPVQQLQSVPLTQLQAARGGDDQLAVKLQILQAEVKKLEEKKKVKALEAKVASLEGSKSVAPAAVKPDTLRGAAKYLAEDRKSVRAENNMVSGGLSADAKWESAEGLHAVSAAGAAKKLPSPQQQALKKELAIEKRLTRHAHAGEGERGQAKADAMFEAAREHVARKDANTSQKDVARLHAEVDVMRDRIKQLERKEHINSGDATAKYMMAHDVDTGQEDVGQPETLKARQQLLTQFREGALHAGLASGVWWQRQAAKSATKRWKLEALSAGANNYDQVQQLKSALQHQQQVTDKLREELRHGGAADAMGARGTAMAGAKALSQQLHPVRGAAPRSWAEGVRDIRREMRGVSQDMDQTAGKEDAIVGRIDTLGKRIGTLAQSAERA